MKKLLWVCALALPLFVACTSNKKSSQTETAAADTPVETTVDSHNARNSLDYRGVYEGVTPCADCEGIKVTVTLNADETFLIRNVYLKNGEEINPSEQNGKYVWDESGSIITLEGAEDVPTRFFVGEKRLTILDQEGNPITGELEAHYVLQQIETY